MNLIGLLLVPLLVTVGAGAAAHAQAGSVSTNFAEYFPGEQVVITVRAPDLHPSSPVTVTVNDPDGKPIFTSSNNPTGNTLTTSINLSLLGTAYGEYTVNARHSGTWLTSTFTVREIVPSDRILDVWTDKPSYAAGDTVRIGGSTYTSLGETLDIEVVQTRQASTDLAPASKFRIADSITSPDHRTFEYSFAIPGGKSGEGTYRLTVSTWNDSKTLFIHAGDDSRYSPSDDLLVLLSGHEAYRIGDTMRFSGFMQYPFDLLDREPVIVTITGPAGDVFSSRASPDEFGNFGADVYARPGLFTEGQYLAEASHREYKASLGFAISGDPQELQGDAAPTDLSLNHGQGMYEAGQIFRLTGTAPGSGVHDRVQIQVFGDQTSHPIYETFVMPRTNGEFAVDLGIQTYLFPGGTYTVRASLGGLADQISFDVAGAPPDAGMLPTLSISTARPVYDPGDAVSITARSERQPDIGQISMTVTHVRGPGFDCDTVLCGNLPAASAMLMPDKSGQYSFLFGIPAEVSASGVYEAVAVADSGDASTRFEVTAVPPMMVETSRVSADGIMTDSRTVSGITFMPRVMSGYLPADSGADLMLLSQSGTCVVGRSAECIVSDSTRAEGTLYRAITVDGMTLNVRYTGPDARSEQFSILPASPEDFLEPLAWTVVSSDGSSQASYRIAYAAS